MNYLVSDLFIAIVHSESSGLSGGATIVARVYGVNAWRIAGYRVSSCIIANFVVKIAAFPIGGYFAKVLARQSP